MKKHFVEVKDLFVKLKLRSHSIADQLEDNWFWVLLDATYQWILVGSWDLVKKKIEQHFALTSCKGLLKKRKSNSIVVEHLLNYRSASTSNILIANLTMYLATCFLRYKCFDHPGIFGELTLKYYNKTLHLTAVFIWEYQTVAGTYSPHKRWFTMLCDAFYYCIANHITSIMVRDMIPNKLFTPIQYTLSPCN